MEVEEKFETVFMRLLGERQGVFQVVGQIGRRVEEPQPDPVVTVVFENLQRGPGVRAVLKDRAAILGLFEKRQVRADGIIRRVAGTTRQRENRQKNVSVKFHKLRTSARRQ